MNDDELERMSRGLGYDAAREPPADRVAALRAAAERLRSGRETTGSDAWAIGTPRHRRQFIVGGIAASCGALLGFGARAILDDDAPTAPPTEALTLSGVASGVQADAALINHTWGTELLLDVAGLPPERDYDVTFTETTGTSVVAGSFRGVADVLMRCRFNAATLRAELATIVVTEAGGGPEVMRVQLA